MDPNDSAAGRSPSGAGAIPSSHLLTAEHGSRPAPGPPALPYTLGQYRLVEKIGRGGMGAVYRALHVRLKKPVAVKLLPPDRVGDPQAVARFEREMEAVGLLDHDHIVRATDAGEVGGVHFLVMELIDGVDLARLIRLRGPLTVADACELVRQAAVGLQYAHENHLVHRDVKPSNLLLSAAGQVKVLDLGLALLGRGGPASGELTVDGQPMGTADYMAPEQWDDSHAVDIRADIYSLGCTLFTLLVGRPPFDGPKHGSLVRKMAAHVGERVRRLAAERGDVPPAVEALLTRMMAKEPADRPATPGEVAQALAPFCSGAGPAALAADALARSSSGGRGSPEAAANAASPVHLTPAGGRTLTATAVPPRRRRGWYVKALGLGGGVALTVLAVVVYLRGVPPAVGEKNPAPPTDPSGPSAHAGWQNLLTRKPTERVWPLALDRRLEYDRDRETLWVVSPKAALLGLGKTDARDYKLQVGFRQTPWTGLIGVYFGGQNPPGSAPFQFQLIDLRPEGPNNFRSMYLARSVGTIVERPDTDPELSTNGFANWRLPKPLDGSEQFLELEVESGRLRVVRWNGEPCEGLGGIQAHAAAGNADCRGEFGIYSMTGSVTVSTARFLPAD